MGPLLERPANNRRWLGLAASKNSPKQGGARETGRSAGPPSSSSSSISPHAKGALAGRHGARAEDTQAGARPSPSPTPAPSATILPAGSRRSPGASARDFESPRQSPYSLSNGPSRHLSSTGTFHEARNRDLGRNALDVAAGRERMFYRYGALGSVLPAAGQDVKVLLDSVRNPAGVAEFIRSKVAEAQLSRNCHLDLEESSNPELFLQEGIATCTV